MTDMASGASADPGPDDDFDPFGGVELERVGPTTESQREVWLADLIGREASLAYSQVVALRMAGQLQLGALSDAISALIARHEALRSTLSADGTSFLVARTMEVPLEFIDLRAVDDAARQAAVDRELARAVEEPFDLSAGPLLRARLLALGNQENLLLLAAHHVVCDGWSLGVIVTDLAVLYAREIGSEAAPLLPADRFSDYAAREASWQKGPGHAADEQYWLSRFQGEPPILELPLDFKRPAYRSFASRREDRLLDAELLGNLKRLAGGMGISLFSLLAGCFAMLLSRLSGQREIVIGVPAAGQPGAGMASLVGHCVNLLPLRILVDPEATATSALATVQSSLLDALDHQRYTYGTLLRRLRIARDPKRVPLIGVMFNLGRSVGLERFERVGLRVEMSAVPRHYEGFELFLNAGQKGDALQFECQYNTDLFATQTVNQWLDGYETLLRAVLAAPQLPVSELPVLDARHSARLSAWNGTQRDFDRLARVDHLVPSRVSRFHGLVAVAAAADQLTYGELESRSNQFSHALRAHGVGRGARVGLCVERGPEMLVALLGILKAGAAYVPLDPAYPAERLAYMAQDAGLAMLVTQVALRSLIEWPRERTLVLDADAGSVAAQPCSALPDDERSARPEDAAYVIYTSGSTGTPKGVMVPHRAVVNFLASMAREPGLGEADRVVAVTTLAFDIAVLELLLPLAVGARVVLASREEAADGHALRALLESSQSTVMQATPSTWRLLIEAGWRGAPGFKALVGGEALPADLAEHLLSRCGEVWNMYGPTETTVWSTCWKVERPERGISIGKPIANTGAWILDANGQLCPIGVPGEICIGGEGVTLGYLNRPELTADRFVPDPFSEASGARLYRTGDRGRWRHDGLLEHLGRLDDQVKVRGFRIELGEIEANLAAHPDIARCVVVTREERPGDVRLVAYLVPRTHMPTPAALRELLRRTLPEYMVPQYFVQIEALPLTPNGKIDRKALPAPTSLSLHDPQRTGMAELQTPSEHLIAGIWAELLGVAALGPDDNFFDLGGHSMLAMQAIARIEKFTGTRLGPQRLMLESLGQLANGLDAAAATRPRQTGIVRRLFGRLARG